MKTRQSYRPYWTPAPTPRPKNSDDETPLYLAVSYSKNQAVVQTLLYSGADTETKN